MAKTGPGLDGRRQEGSGAHAQPAPGHARVSLVSFSGYPEDALWLHLDNGLALLAGAVARRGHEVRIHDLQTLDNWEKLFPHRYRKEYLDLKARFSRFALEWRRDDPAVAEREHALVAEILELEDRIDVETRKVVESLAAGVADDIRRFEPNVIGFKLWAQNCLPHQLLIAQSLKATFPSALFVAGGAAAHLFQEHLLEETDVFDVVAYGPGDDLIVDLVDHALGRTALDVIPGIVYRAGDRIRKNPRRDPNLRTSVPMIYDAGVYLSYDRKMKSVHVEESRGCSNRCEFCIHPDRSGKLTLKPVDVFLDEITALNRSYGFSYFHLAGSNPQFGHLVEICKRLDARDQHFGFMAFHSLRYISTDEMHWLERGNFDWFWIGVETGSDKVATEITKDRKTLRLAENFAIVREAGITTTVSVIAPCPGEDAESAEATVRLLQQLRPDISRAYPPTIEPRSPWFQSTSGNVVVKDHDRVIHAYIKDGMEWHPGNRILPMVFRNATLANEVLYNGRPYREVYFANRQFDYRMREATRREQYRNFRKSQSSRFRQKRLYFAAQIAIDDAILTGEFDDARRLLAEYNDVATCGTLC